MIGLTATMVMQMALMATPASAYQEAYDKASEEGKPLLVLVGATWCPGCRTMKDKVIPELEQDGGLQQVAFTTVDTDEKPDLSRRLLRGNSIPQLVLYTRGVKGWRRAHLTGVQGLESIRTFIRREMEAAKEKAE